jgi:hypothetical protein
MSEKEPKIIEGTYKVVSARRELVACSKDSEWVSHVFDGLQVRRPPQRGEPFWGENCTWWGWFGALQACRSYCACRPDFADEPVKIRSLIAYKAVTLGFAFAQIFTA